MTAFRLILGLRVRGPTRLSMGLGQLLACVFCCGFPLFLRILDCCATNSLGARIRDVAVALGTWQWCTGCGVWGISLSLAKQRAACSVHSPRLAQSINFELAPGDIVVAGSDGLFDNLYSKDLALVVEQEVKLKR